MAALPKRIIKETERLMAEPLVTSTLHTPMSLKESLILEPGLY